MYINNAFFTVTAGNEAKAYAALGALAATIEKNEPDTIFYLIHTPNLDPGVNIYPPPAASQIAFVEGYKDRDAYFKHHTGPYMKEFVGQYGGLFLNMYGPGFPFMILQGMEVADGFIRPEQAATDVFQVEARWVIQPGKVDEVKKALTKYVQAVYKDEAYTTMYTASIPDTDPGTLSIPPVVHDRLIFNSSWKDRQGFLDHGKAPAYQEFLTESGHLFVQALGVTTTTKQPYMTTSVLKRFAGFLRKEAFVGPNQ